MTMSPPFWKQCTYDPRFNTSTARSLHFWKISILTNLEHIVLAYRLVSVQSIHGDPCSLNKNWYWRHSQGNLWFPPLDLIKNFKVPKKIVQFFYIFLCKGITVYCHPIILYQTFVNTSASVHITFLSSCARQKSCIHATNTSWSHWITGWLRRITLVIAGTAWKYVLLI